ncbi:MAG: NIL domain-containing protein [Chloroflexota bacterium]
MADEVIRLIFPPNLLNNPIVNTLIRTYHNLTVNILRADFTQDTGWLEIQIVGQAAAIESAISWLREKGIEIQTLGA